MDKKTVCGSSCYKPTWFYQREDGIFVREADFEAKKHGETVKILAFADVHLNYVNKDDEENEEVMHTVKCRVWNKDAASVKALKKVMDYGDGFDKVVICGDILDYLSCGAMELMDKYIWDRRPDVMATLGGHDATRQMQTGLPNKTSVEERYAVLEKFWRHDIYYKSEVLKETVMLIQLDNGQHKYWECQIEKLKKDLDYARENNLAVLIFQHEPISTGNPADSDVKAVVVYDGESENFYDEVIGDFDTFDDATRSVYKLICENADVVCGVFCGHAHSGYYAEINGSFKDENGKICPKAIPQYVMEGLPYDDYVGHVTEITVR